MYAFLQQKRYMYLLTQSSFSLIFSLFVQLIEFFVFLGLKKLSSLNLGDGCLQSLYKGQNFKWEVAYSAKQLILVLQQKIVLIIFFYTKPVPGPSLNLIQSFKFHISFFLNILIFLRNLSKKSFYEQLLIKGIFVVLHLYALYLIYPSKMLYGLTYHCYNTPTIILQRSYNRRHIRELSSTFAYGSHHNYRKAFVYESS